MVYFHTQYMKGTAAGALLKHEEGFQLSNSLSRSDSS